MQAIGTPSARASAAAGPAHPLQQPQRFATADKQLVAAPSRDARHVRAAAAGGLGAGSGWAGGARARGGSVLGRGLRAAGPKGSALSTMPLLGPPMCLRPKGASPGRGGGQRVKAVSSVDSTVGFEQRTPRSHQARAVNKTLYAFEDEGNTRGRVVMPGGAGKTLVGLWVAEALNEEVKGGVGTVVVLLPSLLLVEQTLSEWYKHKGAYMECMCVASDDKVGRLEDTADAPKKRGSGRGRKAAKGGVTEDDEDEDEEGDITVEELALDLAADTGDVFTVTTDPEVVAGFIEQRTKGLRVVFSTYHSARVLREAQALVGGHQFGLAVFDEAHHMATSVDTFWAQPLEDEFLNIQRRLFLTATPRFRTREMLGGDHLVRSMDDVDVFGPLIYKMTSAEAVAAGVCRPLKLVVAVADADEEGAEPLQDDALVTDEQGRSYFDVVGEHVSVEEVSKYIPIQKTLAREGAKKALVYYNRNSSATRFAKVAGAWLPRDTKVMFLHGSPMMNIRDRRAALKEFEENDGIAVLASSKALQEGIDVKGVDMVVLMDKKQSEVEIGQIAGRARRMGGATKHAVVLVVSDVNEAGRQQRNAKDTQDWIITQVVGTVAATVRALDEIDDGFIDPLQVERMKAPEERDPNKILELVGVDMNNPVLAEELRRRIGLAVLDEVTDRKYEMAGAVQRYIEEAAAAGMTLEAYLKCYGHTSALRWCKKQKSLPDEDPRVSSMLKDVEFSGVLQSLDAWEAKFEDLKAYKEEFGHPNPTGNDLATWVSFQRKLYRQGKLDLVRKSKLETLEGFVWDPLDLEWERDFEALERYKEANGDLLIFSGKKGGKRLFDFMAVAARRDGTLSAERFERLDALGMDWDPEEARWTYYFESLKATLKARAEELKATGKNKAKDLPRDLVQWCETQQGLYKLGELEDNKVSKLDIIGFAWDSEEAERRMWQLRYGELRVFKAKHGHCNVPLEERDLDLWCRYQRDIARGNVSGMTMSDDRREMLQKIGFVWDSYLASWDDRLADLREYKEKRGDLDVKKVRGDMYKPGLFRFRNYVREQKEAGKLSDKELRELEELGVEWPW